MRHVILQLKFIFEETMQEKTKDVRVMSGRLNI